MSIEIRIADSEEVKAAMKAAIDPLLAENHRLLTLIEACDRNQSTMKAALKEALEIARRHMFVPRPAGSPQVFSGVVTVNSGAIYQDIARIAELRKLVES